MRKITKSFLQVLIIILASVTSKALLAKTIKIATVSPEGTFWMKEMREGAKIIKQRTQGRVKFKFYPGGVMGSDESVLRKIRIGQLHGGAVTIGAIAQSAPDVTLYGLPYLFSSLDDATEIRKVTDPMLHEEIKKGGFVSFGFAQGGFTYLMSKEPIRSLDDLRQRKSWIPEKSDVGLAVYRYVGVAPTPLPLADVLTGLQTGLIDTVTTSPIGALALQWHTHIKYVTDQPLNYLAAMMIIDKKVFNKLKESDQVIVSEVMEGVYKKIDEQNKIDNASARAALESQGVQFIQLSDKEKIEWEKIDNSVINEMLDKYSYSKALYEAVTKRKEDAPKFH